MSADAKVPETEFSICPGGPIDRLQARLRLVQPGTRRVVARGVVVALLAWLPLLVFAIAAPGPSAPGAIAFSQDLAAHVRFLVVIPLLIIVEASIGMRTRWVADEFVASGLVEADHAPRYQAIVRRATKLADSFWVEALLLAAVYALLWLMARQVVADKVPFWYEEIAPMETRLTAAGRWYAFVSSPIVVFLFLRWSWRYVVWSWFLARVARLRLRISGAHPDRAGGLGFVLIGHTAFAAVSFAASCVIAAGTANRILHDAIHLKEFQSTLIGFVLLSVVIGVAPLLAFLSPLVRAKRHGLLKYGQLGNHYVQAFDEKWLRGRAAPDEPLLGTSDIQSLADLGGSYERLDNMRVIPVDRRTLLAFAFAAAAPMLPLLLTVMPLRDMVRLVVKALI